MKFGRQFEFYKIPEWSEYYLDYNGIKTVIKFLDKRRLKKKQLKKIKKIKAKLRKLSSQSLDIKSLEEDNNEINTNTKEIKSIKDKYEKEMKELQEKNITLNNQIKTINIKRISSNVITKEELKNQTNKICK